jgi:hypothetical protein
VLQALTGGPLHRVYVRGHDSAGNWGAAVSSELNIPNGLPKVTNLSLTPSVTNGSVPVLLAATGDDSSIGGTIASMSYSLDGGPAVPVALNNPAAAVVAGSGTIPASALSGLAAGTHTVVVSAVDAPLGLTGSAGVVLTVDKLGPATSGGKVEPDPTNGTVGSAVDPTSLKVSAAFTDAVGANNPTTSPIVAAEGFVNNPTGVGGQGFVFVAADGAFGSLSEPSAYGLIPLSEVTALPQGTNTVYVHAKDAAGNWGDLTPIQFTVDTVKPTLSTPTAVQTAGGAGRVTVSTTLANPTAPAATGIVAAEYFLGTTDPGAGLGTALPGALTPGPITLSLTGIPVGSQTIVVRVKDAAGNWSAPVSVTLTVRSEPIFTDTFGAGNGGNAGNSTAWAARTTGANAPTYPVGTGLGMNTRFVMRSAANSGNSYVTTPTISAADPAGTYYARFLFRPDTLTVTNTGARILSVRSGANTERVGLRYNRANATTSASVCLVVAGVVSTSCANLAVGTTYSLGVKWSPGAGGAQLFVNGAATGAPVNVGTGLTVDRALLGVIGGTGTGIGQAYFDFFTASRFGLPA